MNNSITTTPFANSDQTVITDQPTTTQQEAQVFEMETETPFLTVFESSGDYDGADANQEAFVAIMDELFDEEGEVFLEDFANNAQDWYESFVEEELDNNPNAHALKSQFTEERYAPFLQEIEQFMNAAEEEAEKVDKGQMTSEEMEIWMDNFAPTQSFETPEFENLFGWVKKKLKKVVKVGKGLLKKGLKYAKKFGLSFIVKRLKKIVKQFLKYFLKKAMNRIPRRYRGLVNKLKNRFFKKEIELELEENEQAYHQLEFNAAVAEMFLAENEANLDLMTNELFMEEEATAEDPVAIVSKAREKFIQQISNLEEGEDAGPAVEEFVMVIMTALKWAIRIIGRNRVKKLLINLLSKLIGKLVGKQNGKALSGLIINQGFKILNLEMTEEEHAQIGGRAIASTIEETVRQVAQLPTHVLENEVLLESYVVESFEKAAAANLPDMLNEETYKRKPHLRESAKRKSLWMIKKLRRRKRSHYKKWKREFEMELNPYMAEEIKTFGGLSLSSFLQNRYGVAQGATLPVRVHLYELMPGGKLFHISKYEKISGLGSPQRAAWSQLHPLTSVAAGMLFNEPALGCRSRGKCLQSGKIGGGHRYYYLEFPGQNRRTIGSFQNTMAKMKLDFVKNELNFYQYLSEADAQAIAMELRKNRIGNGQRLTMLSVESGLRNMIKYPGGGQVLVAHPMVFPGLNSGLALQKIAPVVLAVFQEKMSSWVSVKLADYFQKDPQSFIQATENSADGVTICLKFVNPPDFQILSKMMSGNTSNIPAKLFDENSSLINVTVKTGYQYA